MLKQTMIGYKFEYGPAIAPAIISRVPVFAPSLRAVTKTKWEAETSWGQVKVEGRLGGIHRRILDSMFAYALANKALPGGTMALLADPYRIMRGIRTASNDHKWLLNRLEEMRTAKIQITAGGLIHVGGIISEYREAKRRAKMPGGDLQWSNARHCVDRPLLTVIFSAAWMRIYDITLVVSYRNLLPKLHAIKSGPAYAIALFCITHRTSCGQSIVKLLEIVRAIRPDMTDRSKRKAKAAVEDEKEALAEIGIILKNGFVWYKQHPQVRFHGVKSKVEAEPICPAPEPICPAPEPICPVD